MSGGALGATKQVRASGSVAFNAGAPSFVSQSGDFEAAITDNGAGDITINFKAGNGMDSAECQFVANKRGALAASQLCAFGLVHVSDTAKRITILQEGAAGAVSALTDLDFDFAFIATGL